MHYIRFLKPPRLVSGNSSALTAKVTITTDLGEAFLGVDVALLVELEDGSGKVVSASKKEVLWKGNIGMRALEVMIPLPPSRSLKAAGDVKVLIRPKEGSYAINNLDTPLLYTKSEEDDYGDSGSIVAVRSMPVDFTGKTEPARLAERVFYTKETSDLKQKIHIWEETGESIARHIWDAGLLLSSYLANLCQQITTQEQPSDNIPFLPLLKNALSSQNLNIIELGAGCGIASLTLFNHLSAQISTLLLTDLPEASSILTRNLSHLPPSNKISHQVLDWSLSLRLNVAETKWDIIFVADCTYNPDVVPDLVQTLGRIAEGNREVVICLAMKIRHECEMVFFELMAEKGFVVTEKCSLYLPVLGGEGERIEIFVFVANGCFFYFR